MSGYWYISPEDAQHLSPLLAGVFNANLEFEPKASVEDSGLISSERSESGNIGVVRICGALTKYDTLCSYGMLTYGQIIKSLENNPSVKAIVLNIDSPGGSVDGTDELGQTIKGCSKPVVAYVSGLAASAGYWLASCCNEIICNTDIARVGSIGVMCSMRDMRESLAQSGVKVHDIYAPQSKDKNKDYIDALDGNYEGVKKSLGVMADKFHEVVKANRPAITSEHLTGKVYFAKEVVGSMVDSVGNFDFAIQRASALVASCKPKNKKNMTKLKSMATVIGVDGIESVDGSISLTLEQAEAIETAFDGISSTQTELQSVTSARDTAMTEKTALQNKVSALESQIALLQNKPGAASVETPGQLSDSDENGPAAARTFSEAADVARTFINQFNQ